MTRANKQKQTLGFTIVELLIVIVVIAILAAIMTIAYGGIADRANTARTIDSVSQANTAINAYYVMHNVYPNGSEDDTSMGSFCLGTGFPDGACSMLRYSDGCEQAGTVIPVTKESAGFLDELSGFIDNGIPAVVHPPVQVLMGESGDCQLFAEYTGATYVSAAYVRVNDEGKLTASGYTSGAVQDAYYISYYVKGENADCGPGNQSDPDFMQIVTPGWTACEIWGGDMRPAV